MLNPGELGQVRLGKGHDGESGFHEIRGAGNAAAGESVHSLNDFRHVHCGDGASGADGFNDLGARLIKEPGQHT